MILYKYKYNLRTYKYNLRMCYAKQFNYRGKHGPKFSLPDPRLYFLTLKTPARSYVIEIMSVSTQFRKNIYNVSSKRNFIQQLKFLKKKKKHFIRISCKTYILSYAHKV